ncbi:RHS repeat-associated core domain-containing protein [Parachlamydia sp. AcF125]|uniref:RHS repeat-associated core domain-containing protein n=1 Tax=Parachlamydia sp. AcF125 TaxID=2795736 RepID=UPI0020167BAE|nr:RHS repeat-associated core domain-containing protein [Parachlamydia sp. AcF125]
MCVFICLFFAVWPLFSEEAHLEKKFAARAYAEEETRITQANLTGIPSAFVGGVVNAITGDLALCEVDLVIPGTNPLAFERTYSSSFNKNGTLELGWNLNHLTRLKVLGEGVSLNEGQGALTLFKLDSQDNKFHVSTDSISHGMTNCGKGEISGRTNTKNTYLIRSPSTKHGERPFYKLCDGAGVENLYKKLKKSHNRKYLLEQTTFPNGNLLSYSYDDEHQIKYCALKSGGEHLTGFKFSYTDQKNIAKTSVQMEDGRQITYYFHKIHGEWCLCQVERPDGIITQYDYQNGKYDHYPRLCQKKFSDTHYTNIHYWMKKDTVEDGKVIRSKDRQRFRVKALEEPVGADGKPVQTYRFEYYLNAHDLGGKTEVFDVNHSKTIYCYNQDQRLTALDYYGEGDHPYRQERLYWGLGADAGNLIAQTIAGSENVFSLIHTFKYDAAGNPLEEEIYGNLSGKNPVPPQIDQEGKAVKNGCEHHIISRTFTTEGFNLKLSETEGAQKNAYTYYPGKDLLKTKFVYDHSALQYRHFYAYNPHGFLTREIIDDGAAHEKNDLTNVTQRIIREFSERQQAPFGLTQEEKLLYADANGHETCVKRVYNFHDALGQLYEQHHYDLAGNLRYRLQWEYDSRGNVIRQVNAQGEETLCQYNDFNQLIYEQGPNQAYHTEYTYDGIGRQTSLITVDHSDNQRYTISYQYDKRNNRISTSDWYGNQTNYQYDRFDRLVKTLYPPIPSPSGQLYRPEEQTEYNALNHVTKMTNGNGHSLSQRNTIRGQPFSIIYADGSSEIMTYHLDGTLQEKIDKNGMITRYSYDYQKRPVRIEYLASSGESLGYHAKEYSAFHLMREMDAEGHVTAYQYDSLGRLSAILKEDAAIYYTYDTLGRKNSIKTFFGSEPTDYTLEVFEYDLKDRVVEERKEDAQGTILRKQTYVYDASDNKLQISTYSDAGVGTTYFTYNFNNQPTKIVDPDNNTTYLTYNYNYRDAYDMVVPYSESTDPKGNVTIVIGNALGKTAKVQRKNSLGQITQERDYFYDGAGQLIETREKVFKLGRCDRQVITQWTYDPIGQLASCMEAVGTPEQKTTLHAYNNSSQKVATYKPDGNQILFTYDPKGRLSTVTSADQTLGYAYSYNLNDCPIVVEDLIHHTQSRKTYDANERLIEEILGNGLKLSYTYDRQGRILTTTLPDQSSLAYAYNAADLIAVKRFSASGEEQYKQTYRYDQAGNLKERQLPFNLGTVSHSYDLLNRHRSTHSPYFSEVEVQYDNTGNLTSHLFKDPLGELPCKYEYDSLYQLSREDTLSSHTYQHDSLFNRFGKDEQSFEFNALNQLLGDKLGAYSYDRNGNLAEKGDQKYTYDAWDRLISVTTDTKRFTYVYDELNRRLCKEAAQWDPSTHDWTPQEKQYFLYQGENEIGLCDAAYNLRELRVLGYGRGAEIGAAIAFEMEGKTYLPFCTFAGNTRVLLNSCGKPMEIYRYTAFGEEVSLDASGTPKAPTAAWRFSSKRYDPETGFIYFGRRYYDPQTARWTTADPLSYAAGPNLYAYVNNSPLTHLDLYGLWHDWVDARRERRFYARVKTNVTNYHRSRENRPGRKNNSVWFWDSFEKITPRQVNSCIYNTSDQGYLPLEFGGKIMICNGMNNTFEEARGHASYVSSLSGYRTDGVYNSTKNFIIDTLEAALGLGGIGTTPARLLRREWRKFHETAPPGVKILQFCTSQGAIHVKNGLNASPQAIRNRVFVVAVAPADYIERDRSATAVHYVAKPYRDFVPRLNVLKAITTKAHVVSLPSHQEADWFDHSFQSPTYKEAINSHIQTYIESKGSEI